MEAVTLEQARALMQDPVDLVALDHFRRYSWLLDHLTFRRVVSATGEAWVYAYTILRAPSMAGYRKLNHEFPLNVATTERKIVEVKMMGGAFNIDRALSLTAFQQTTGFQLDQKVKATANFFSDRFINGVKPADNDDVQEGEDEDGFDGLSRLLADTETEIDGSEVDLTAVNSLADANEVLAVFDELFANLDGTPDAVLVNRNTWARLTRVARFANALGETRDNFGKQLATVNGVPLVNLGDYVTQDEDGDQVTVPIIRNTVGGGDTTSDIYAVRFGEDGVSAVGLQGAPLIRTYVPQFDQQHPGAVKRGEAELYAAPILKNTRAAGVIRGVKIG